jgi:hypothetical protein
MFWGINGGAMRRTSRIGASLELFGLKLQKKFGFPDQT